MKANHNAWVIGIVCGQVVVNISISKNESKSQRTISNAAFRLVVVNISISKNESKSQLIAGGNHCAISCGKYQYFKE